MISLGVSTGPAPDTRATLAITGDGADYASVSGAVVYGAVSAVEAVAQRVEAMMSRAMVQASERVRMALCPPVLGQIGRWAIVTGESLHLLDVTRGGRLLLTQVAPEWDVDGDRDPRTWQYGITVYAPERAWYVRAPRARVLHILRSPEPSRPEHGISPLSRASLTFNLARLAEDALGRESRLPSKAILPMPQGTPDQIVQQLRADLQAADKTLAMPETTRAGGGAGLTSAPVTDWKAQRIQAMPSPALVDVAQQASDRVVSSMGVLPALVGSTGVGSADREAAKQFVEYVLEPLAHLVSYEASMLFGEPVRLRWPPRDDVLRGRAQTAKIFQEMGMELGDALEKARLTE